MERIAESQTEVDVADADAAVARVRALAQQWIDNMPDNFTESPVAVIFAEAGQRVLDALDGS